MYPTGGMCESKERGGDGVLRQLQRESAQERKSVLPGEVKSKREEEKRN